MRWLVSWLLVHLLFAPLCLPLTTSSAATKAVATPTNVPTATKSPVVLNTPVSLSTTTLTPKLFSTKATTSNSSLASPVPSTSTPTAKATPKSSSSNLPSPIKASSLVRQPTKLGVVAANTALELSASAPASVSPFTVTPSTMTSVATTTPITIRDVPLVNTTTTSTATSSLPPPTTTTTRQAMEAVTESLLTTLLSGGSELRESEKADSNATMGGQASQPIYDAEPTMYGIVFAISAGCILFMLYMSFFGRRMRFTAIRWHTINHNLWNLLQLLAFSHAAIKTPWRDYLADTFIAQYNELITAFCLSVYPTGMIFVYIEQMVHLFCPRYRDPIFCNSVLWLCVFIFVNTLMVVLFFAFYWWPKEFFYTPILFYQIVVTVLFDFFTGIYFLFCFFTTITHCCVMKRMRRSRGVMFFVNMWLLLPYSVISCIMIAPKFSFTMAMFIIQFFIDFIIELMMKNPQMAGGASPPSPSDSLQNPMMVTWLSLVEPFLLYLPVAQAILTIVCIPMYRQQFIFVITCGRYYTNKAKVGSSCSSTTSWLASSANGFQAGEGKQVPPSEYVSSPPSYPSLDKHDED